MLRHILLCLTLISLSAAKPALAEGLTVFAAASLKSALGKVGDLWAAQTGQSVTFNFAGTPTLARQIQAGAPADIFVSASRDWMDALAETGDIVPGSQFDLLGNSLVLVAHGADGAPLALTHDTDLAGLVGDGKLAMAFVDAVPAGIYGKQALTNLGLWDSVAQKVVQADSVTGALQFVAGGEAGFGIVYATDARGLAGVSVLGTFPAGSHDPITYPAALTAQSNSASAAAFLDFLRSAAARDIWQAAGFVPLP